MTGPVQFLVSWMRSHERELTIVSGLALLTALAFLLRWDVLAQNPYPPSNDVGGDLYSAQQWLGNPIPGLWVDLQPPLYYWLVVIPAVHFLGPFTGPEVYMALVPALLVFPGYAFCRETGASVLASAIGAFGLAMATTLSLMVTWNGAYNALGILFLTIFATFLVRSLSRGRNPDAIAAGVFLTLVAATHELTFLVGAIAFVVSTALSLALVDHRRATLRAVLIILATAILCFLPLIPIYWNSLTSTTNNGVGGYQSQLVWAFTYFPTFAWGFQGPTQSLLAFMDVAVTAVGLLVLWWKRATRHSAIVLSSLWIGGLVIAFASSSNAVRGLYYITLPATLVAPAFFEGLLGRRLAPVRASPPGEPAVGFSRRRARWGGAYRLQQSEMEIAALALASLLLFTYLNVSFSIQTMEVSARYYMSLSDDNVAALRWLATHTNLSDGIMDTTGIQPWVWGLAHRTAFAPVPLGFEVTAASYSNSQLADQVWLGTHLAGNSQLTIADNAPSPLGVPNVFVNVPGYWQKMVSTQSDLVNFNFRQGNSTSSATLVTATLVGSNSSTLPSGEVRIASSYWWTNHRYGVNETIVLNGSTVNLQWIGWNATLTQTTEWFGLPPPSPLYVLVTGESDVNLTTALENRYQMGNARFSMSWSGGTFHQSVAPNGWGYVWCNTTGTVQIVFAGLPSVRSVTPFVEDTSVLVHDLKILFFLSNPYKDYSTFLRLVREAITGAHVKQVFQAGSTYIFGLTFAGNHPS